MKKLILILFVLISMEAFSQISVKEGSFKHIPEGVILNKNEYTDINNHPMALIKISTENINEYERGRLRFAGNMATEVIKEYDTGKVLVYLTAKNATFLKIAHPDYGECKYQLENLCDYCVYEMVVRYDGNPNNENTLIIKTDQVDANIYIDNEYIDKQYGHKRLMVGSTHTWKIECDSFRTESGEITITNDENVIDIKMLSVFVDITVKTDYKSYIFIDGVQKAKGSWTGKLMEGTYVFEARKENHRTTQKTVVIVAGNNQTIILDSPESINGSLDVSTIPAGADIYIDKKEYGKTPNNINEILIGEHELKLVKQGYTDLKKKITIKEGEMLIINEKLSKSNMGFSRIFRKIGNFCDDLAYVFEPEDETLGVGYKYSKYFPVTLSLNMTRSFVSLFMELGINTDNSIISDYNPRFYMMFSPGLYFRFMSINCGIGYLPGDYVVNLDIENGNVVNTEKTKTNYYMLKPSITGYIPISDEDFYITVDVGYNYFPNIKELNGLSLGLGFQWVIW